MTKRFTTLALALTTICFTSLMGADGGCGGPPVLDNNGFDLWCGNQLCYWEVEAGSVVKAPTWHRSDFGAEFVGPVAAISQLSDIGSSTDCLRFRAVANIDLDAIVTVEVDYFDDGVYDVEQRVPASDWAQIEFELPTPEFFDGARFRIRKEGNSAAILAEMQVTRNDKCVEPPVVIPLRDNGLACSSDLQCESGVCLAVEPFVGRICAECERSSDCDTDQACGVRDPLDPDQPLTSECGAPARHDLGERCVTNDECASDICCDGVCSSCCADFRDGACSSDCGPAEPAGPSVCDPASGLLATDAPCFNDSQCASGLCVGADFRVCLSDGRVCGEVTDCEGNVDCAKVGVADGICQ